MDERKRLTTFLQGIEPRAWVFVNVQCDDPVRAAAVFRDTIRAFAEAAKGEPLARWPMCFWTTLLAQPGLTADSEAAANAGGLARVPPGPRAAFLLPMIAGLNEAHATEALGISSRSLAHALVRARTAWPDPDAHDALRRLLQERVRAPTAADRRAIQALRAEALGEPAPVVAATASAPRRWRAWWLPLALVLLALIAISLWLKRPLSAIGDSEPLPLDVVPSPPVLDAAAIVTHPDYATLAAPEDATLVDNLARLSWFAAGAPSAASPPPAADPATATPTDFDDLPMDELDLLTLARPSWPGLDEATRQRLMAQARDWLQRSPFERAALRQRMLDWDGLDATQRARRRAPFDAWRLLPGDDQRRVRDAARRWAALLPAEQVAAQSRFAQLPADEQRLWWLGPTLGRELAPIAAHFAFLPADQRDAFLAMLRGLDAGARGDFSRLSERLDPVGRERLRRDLQALAPDQRGAWLQARRDQ